VQYDVSLFLKLKNRIWSTKTNLPLVAFYDFTTKQWKSV
jgi:hypothetical protein